MGPNVTPGDNDRGRQRGNETMDTLEGGDAAPPMTNGGAAQSSLIAVSRMASIVARAASASSVGDQLVFDSVTNTPPTHEVPTTSRSRVGASLPVSPVTMSCSATRRSDSPSTSPSSTANACSSGGAVGVGVMGQGARWVKGRLAIHSDVASSSA